MTIEAAQAAAMRSPTCVRAASAISQAHTINLVFIVEEGPRAYIERINIRGNTRTRDYVIRREFDIGEGDAYNRALIDRAERRLKNLNFFKTVKITNEPGSAPDRIIVNVDVEEQPTGEFSVAGGYSTADGFLAEVSVAERNLLGRGQYAKASVTMVSAPAGSNCRSSSRICSAIAWLAASTSSRSKISPRASSPTIRRASASICVSALRSLRNSRSSRAIRSIGNRSHCRISTITVSCLRMR